MSIADEDCSGNAGHLTSSQVAGDVMPALNSDDTETSRHDLLKVARELIPPGRANRKLRGHVAEVKKLREAGYSISGIQQVLAATGIHVGQATVARELAKLAAAAAPTPPSPEVATTTPEKTPIETAVPDPKPELKPLADVKTKVPTADEFFKSYNDNPLFRRKGNKP